MSDDIFETEVTRETIFEDRDVLSPHYIPDKLPHREKQIERIMEILAPALSHKRPSNLFIYGKTGSGKTVCSKRVLQKLNSVKEKYDADVEDVYTNCRVHNTRYQVFTKTAEAVFPDEDFRGYSSTHLYDKMLDYIEDKNLTFIFVLDELDKVKDLDDLIYTLTRANDDLNQGRVVIIGISNRVTFKEKLDPRSKSTLCQEEMVFPPYNAEELHSILEERAEEGFKQGMFKDSAIASASAFAANESGDARYALKLLIKAGEIADKKAEPVTDDHVQEARSAVEKEIVFDLIESLPEHQGIVLQAVASLSKEGGKYSKLVKTDEEDADKVLFSGEVYDRYDKLCRDWSKKPRSSRWFREYLNELEMLGLITTNISGKGVRGNTRLIRLSFPPDEVKEAVEEKFK